MSRFGYQPSDLFIANPLEYFSGRNKHVRVFGENNEIDTATAPEDIWEYGGVMTYSNTPTTYYLSSSDAGDDMNLRVVVLQDDGNGNWDEAIFYPTASGQDKVTIGADCVRLLSIENIGSADASGTVYVYSDSTLTDGIPDDTTAVKGIIFDGNNTSMFTHYTIPTGYVGFLLEIGAGVAKYLLNAGAKISIRIRRYGSVFCNRGVIALSSVGTSYAFDKRIQPDPLPAKTDFKMVVDEVSANDFSAFGRYELLLIPEDDIPDSYLDAIGQIRRV